MRAAVGALLPLLAGCLGGSLPEIAPLKNDETPGEALARALLRSFHEWRSTAFPVEVSLEGRHEYDGTFGGLTPVDCARRIRALEYYADRIDSVGSVGGVSPATARALAALRARIAELIARQKELRDGLGFDPETVAAGLRVLMEGAVPGRARALVSRLNEAAPVLQHVPDAEQLLAEIEAWFEALPDEDLRELGRRAVRRAR